MHFIYQHAGNSYRIDYLRPYYPSYGGKNIKHTGNSVIILDFKKGEISAKTTIYPHIKKAIEAVVAPPSKPIVIATVPSSTVGNEHKSFPSIIRQLSNEFNVMNTGNKLQRIISRQKAHLGGSRDFQGHIDSIEVVGINRGDNVILLDDITSTGSSLAACTKLLQDAGAHVLLALAIGRTSS